MLPGAKVEKAFGKRAGHHYGGEMTLLEALHGRGDVYRTLLREATTALLNSHMNRVLSTTPQQALEVALRFKRANSGAWILGFAYQHLVAASIVVAVFSCVTEKWERSRVPRIAGIGAVYSRCCL